MSLLWLLFLVEQTYEDLDEILARFVQPMAANAKDLIVHKCYMQANGGNSDELKRKLQEEKAKNPKRIPYFFSASKQLPGKFLLGYQPGSKPRIEYVTVTPDGFRYRDRVHDSVNSLLNWFKEHYQDPVPRPVQTSSSSSGGVSVGGAQIPSHISRNLDYSQLQAAVNTANQQHSVTGNTPYTPTHLAYSRTPTPQYGGQQQYYGGHHQRENAYQQRRQQFMGGQLGDNSGSGGSWRTDYTAQTPGRTPAYTPTQTPHSVSSVYGGTPPMGRGGLTPRGRLEPPGTPVRDE